VFIAGGIGITPLMPMIAAAERAGQQWELHYGGRSRSSMAFVAELEREYGDRVHIQPMDEVGLLDLPTILRNTARDALIYCCGPEPLLTAVQERCTDRPTGVLHIERFARRASVDSAVQACFEVELRKSGLSLKVPAGESILQVVRAAGVSVASSCEEGTCGTCETVVVAGRPDHRDSLLTDEERASSETIMLCVSRCLDDRLVLEL
jgi:ferredoxin-NADP reductase